MTGADARQLLQWTVVAQRATRQRPQNRECHLKEQVIEFDGEVTEALPNAMFRVQLDNDHEVLSTIAGKMRRFRIRVLPGDRVRVSISPYDLNRGRIILRHK